MVCKKNLRRWGDGKFSIRGGYPEGGGMSKKGGINPHLRTVKVPPAVEPYWTLKYDRYKENESIYSDV